MTGLSCLLHASCVAVKGRGLLIRGPSGSGKSGLALQLMAFGAQLVADDQTLLQRDGNNLIASCPGLLSGLIEARGVGILRSLALPMVQVAVAVDMAENGTERLPEPRQCDILGVRVDLVQRVDAPHFASALMCLLSDGRHA